MAEPHWSLHDAKNQFSAVVKAAVNDTPQTITKHGKPAVVVVSFAEYQRLTGQDTARKPSFIDHLLAMPRDDGEFERLQIEPRDIEV